MNRRQPFVRKIIYLAVIAALLLPLAALSKPSTADSSGRYQPNKGGVLAQLRDEQGLAQGNLGEIDPSSEAIKLATLGMRGVAANILWTKVNNYRRVEDWTSMSATLEQITKLQPNFVTVWRFQGWNLAYNVSVEFDDYNDRYYWVMRGINFLEQGTKYNDREPILLWDMGHFISQKIGRSDEHRLFRKLFVADDDFHGNRPAGERDNWLVGRGKFIEAEQAVESGKMMKGQSPLIYLSNAPLCLVYLAIALEEEGHFDQATRNAWDQASHGWREFGQRSLKDAEGEDYRLEDMAERLERWRELQNRLIELAGPDAQAAIVARKREKLTQAQRDALDMNPADRTMKQHQTAFAAGMQLAITNAELAEQAPAEKRAEARRLAEEADHALAKAQYIDTSRNIVNYAYWGTRCDAEKTEQALAARSALYEADQAFRDVEIERARELYEQGFQSWREVLDAFPVLVEDSTIGDDLVRAVKRYRRCLQELKVDMPRPFILQDVLKEHEIVDPRQG